MNMKDVENIEMKINVPSNMTPETAQQCFILGLRTLTYMYNQGVVVSYLDEFKNERNIKSLALRNEDAASVIKFVDFLQNMNETNFDKKIKTLEEKGNEIIKENYLLKSEKYCTDKNNG